MFYVLVLVASVSAAGMTVLESRHEYRQAVEHVDALVSLLTDWTRQELAAGRDLSEIEAAYAAAIAELESIEKEMPHEP